MSIFWSFIVYYRPSGFIFKAKILSYTICQKKQYLENVLWLHYGAFAGRGGLVAHPYTDLLKRFHLPR